MSPLPADLAELDGRGPGRRLPARRRPPSSPRHDLTITSMGRGPADDPAFFAAAGAAAALGRRPDPLARALVVEAPLGGPGRAVACAPMSAAKLERLLNLTALLLETPRPLSAAEIRDRARRLPRRDRRVPPGVRARQGRPPGHGRAARGRDRPRGGARRRGLPHPEGPLLPPRPRARPPTSSPPCASPRRSCSSTACPPARASSSWADSSATRATPPTPGSAWRWAACPGATWRRCSGRSPPRSRCGSPTAARCAPSTRTASTSPGGAGT